MHEKNQRADCTASFTQLPEAIRPYAGCPDSVKNIPVHWHGYPSYMERAFERCQLDHAILACDATINFLYHDYTPTKVTHTSGRRPLLEEIVTKVCGACRTDLEIAQALVMWRRNNMQHIPVCGLGTEEEILLGGYSMCHDAARTLITLCHVAGLSGRMIIGLNDANDKGHTLTEIFINGKWSLFDPTAYVPFAWLEDAGGNLASAWDVRRDPSLPQRCKTQTETPMSTKDYGEYFADYRIVNYPLEFSNHLMAQRFTRMITAQKIIQNYDYIGHLNNKPVAGFTDLDAVLSQWVDGTLTPTPKSYRF